MAPDPTTPQHLLIVDDDRLLGDSLVHGLADLPLTIECVHQGSSALTACEKARYDLILLDQKLPDANGEDLCTRLLSHNEATKIIFMTAYPSFDNALAAIKVGAYDYLSKPFELDAVRLALQRALHTARLERVAQADHYQREQEAGRALLLGNKGEMAEVQRLVDLAAAEDAAVLITGETGTGKGVAAKTIHARGKRSAAPFISINCAAIPAALMEAELFGYEQGAFTGAAGARPGIFETAAGGSLLLDELGEMPQNLQAKLLGVLDDKKVQRIGSQTARHVDTRVIAATNRPLEQAMQSGGFRQDLYYRLSVIVIAMPPLRSHIGDLPALCDHFLRLLAPRQPLRIAPAEMARLSGYHWPGNVRELRNILERAVILQEGPNLFPSRLLQFNPVSLPPTPQIGSTDTLSRSLRSIEQAHIQNVLSQCDHNHSHAARVLEISRSTLIRKLKTYGFNGRDGACNEGAQ
jgi:DNA-binding NtrC family response regulator